MTRETQSTIKRALAELRALRARAEAAEGAVRAPVAVIGMALRLPGGVSDASSFADVLWSGIDAIGEIPSARWALDEYYADDVDAPGKMTTRFGGFIDNIDQFDAAFFGISPREAASMDPQQRLLLELAWEALEDAGVAPDALKGARSGVYVGLGNCDYGRAIFPNRDLIDPYFATGTSYSVAAGRIAYTLGLTGPAVTVDTACSSSLTALHLAVQALRLRECDAALAGGASLILSPEMNVSFTKGRMMSPDGRCKTFDAAADGYVRGEGGVVLALKRLEDARRDRDRVLAIIRGTALNQDGRSNGITAPNGPAQEAVIRAAMENGGVEPDQIGYVEAHGTGTPLGDPIEIGALQAVIGSRRPDDRPLLVGSVKTNIGHTEAAAGLAGAAKAIVALQKGSIPQSLNFRTGNPHIDWENARIEVPVAPCAFPTSADGRRIAGVSSFGFSGTNAHVVIEGPEPTPNVTTAMERSLHVLTLSARTPAALSALVERWRVGFEAGSDPADLCHTANVGRAALEHRTAIVGRTTADFANALAAVREGTAGPEAVSGTPDSEVAPRIAFMFTGQGAHFAGMGSALYETAPAFRATLDRCAAAALPYVSRSLEDPLVIQPANFAFQVALAELWRGWGIEPVAAIGHSLGEYAAAHMAGVFNLEDAMAIVAARGRGAALCHGRGAMVAVSAPHERVMRALGEIGELELAACNGPEDFVVSGAPQAVEALAETVRASDGRAKILAVPFGSHSRWVEPALPELDAALARVSFSSSRIALAANPTGALAAPTAMSNAAYWRAQMRQTVRFAPGVAALAGIGITHFIEIGPHPILCAAGAECLGERGQWLASMRRDSDGWSELLAGVQRLFVDGARLDWKGFDRGYPRHRIAGPTYPFQRARHWIDAAHASVGASAAEAWTRASAAAERQSAQGPLDLDVASYPPKWDVLERITRGLIVDALHGAGLFRDAMRIDRDALLSRLGVGRDFRPLVQRWLNRLVSAGDLGRDGDVYFCAAPLASPDLGALWAEAESCFTDNKELLAYVRHCAGLALEVVTGRESPLETLFPGGSFALAEDLYERSATMRYINALAASAVAAYAAAAPRGRAFRVLEIGAGTGATTAAVAPSLPPRCAYHFSDVSDFFLDAARGKFAGYPEMRFVRFDLDIPLEEQSYEDGRFDLILAANAVHASVDLAATLDRLRRLLAPGGLLALVESTKSFAWFDVTTGLIEGWRQHMDELRADGPLLSADGWTRALTGAGFAGVACWPAPGTPAEAMGQHLVLARAPGEFGASVAAMPEVPEDAAGPIAVVPHQIEPIDAAVRGAPVAEQLEMMRGFVRAQVMSVLRLKDGDEPGRQERLTDLGLDSLMAVQLRNRLSRGLSFAKPLPATLMFDYPTIEKLAARLLSMLVERGERETVPGPAMDRAPIAISAARVARMSEADIETLLATRGRR
jgi:acyl transferase domain-containing protein/SAM-dependent methyltransferase